jgi:hypothetical protein
MIDHVGEPMIPAALLRAPSGKTSPSEDVKAGLEGAGGRSHRLARRYTSNRCKWLGESCGGVVMSRQRTFASMAWQAKGKVTRRERFLAEMDAVIPWARLLALIEPHYPKAGQGRQPLGLEKMLRIYFLQQWFNLSDPQAEDAIYDSESMRRFARVELGDEVEYRSALSPPAGAARVDAGDFRGGSGSARRTALVAALGHHRRRDHYRGAELDQKRRCGAPTQSLRLTVHRSSPITPMALRRGSMESFMNPLRG